MGVLEERLPELDMLIDLMTRELGRLPTEVEVFDFIMGDREERLKILHGE